MIAIISALHAEITGIKHAIRAREISSHQEALRYSGRTFTGSFDGRDILLLQSGMGKENALQAAKFAIAWSAKHSISLNVMLSLGFSGGLSPALIPGDLVLCQKISVTHPSSATRSCHSDPALLVLAQNNLPGSLARTFSGDSLTVDRPVALASEKAALQACHQAIVVDMESYWVACVAEDQNIPFLEVRAVSDTAGEELPPFDRFISLQGAWQARAALAHFAAHPGELSRLPGLSRNASAARRNLTLFFSSFVPCLQEVHP